MDQYVHNGYSQSNLLTKFGRLIFRLGNRSADKGLVVYYEPEEATPLHLLVTSKKRLHSILFHRKWWQPKIATKYQLSIIMNNVQQNEI